MQGRPDSSSQTFGGPAAPLVGTQVIGAFERERVAFQPIDAAHRVQPCQRPFALAQGKLAVIAHPSGVFYVPFTSFLCEMATLLD
jgi:hypothetical protein